MSNPPNLGITMEFTENLSMRYVPIIEKEFSGYIIKASMFKHDLSIWYKDNMAHIGFLPVWLSEKESRTIYLNNKFHVVFDDVINDYKIDRLAIEDNTIKFEINKDSDLNEFRKIFKEIDCELKRIEMKLKKHKINNL
jgi:hypothetical protein